MERTYLSGAGFPEARLEGLDINWCDPYEATEHSALWADNGAGKTTITALRFGLYLPHAHQFIRGDSDRSLAKLVRSGDVCHVVEQATRVIGGELQRIVMGMVAHWTDGGVQDLKNPRKLHREFYGWTTYGSGPTIANLPFHTSRGRRTTYVQFVNAVKELMPDSGVLPPHRPSEHHEDWLTWLSAADIDLEQSRFQARMNRSEGGVDQIMRFPDADAFVRWLVGATVPPKAVGQIGKSIDVLRTHAAARPQWENELTLWERTTEPLRRLAVVHEHVIGHRRSATAAEADAARVVADADATLSGLAENKSAAERQRAEHEQYRKDAAVTARRAQAHRLRMQVRGAELRAKAAAAFAKKCRTARDRAARDLAAWELVATVQQARRATSRLAGLNERLAATEKKASELHADERRYRHALARLLTAHRDAADDEVKKAERRHRRAVHAFSQAEDDRRDAVAQRAATAEQIHQAEEQVSQSERAIAGAVAAGLLPEGADPATTEATWAAKMAAAREQRQSADKALRESDKRAAAAQTAANAARREADAARTEEESADRRRCQVDDWIHTLAHDDRLRTAVGDTAIEVWGARPALTDALNHRAETADADANEARAATAVARRTLESVGSDGLLPAAELVEEMTERCVEAEAPAWSGWRWLADTMTAEAASAFAAARPEIASGVVVAHPDLLDSALQAVRDVDIDTAVWIGAVLDPEAAAARLDPTADDGTHAQVLLPHPGTFDREAAGDVVATATEAAEEAEQCLQEASHRAKDARDMLAALHRLWDELPDDPRPGLAARICAAQERRERAETAEETALAALEDLAHEKEHRRRERDDAQHDIEDAAEKRRLLTPLISAASTLFHAGGRLPGLRTAVAEIGLRVDGLDDRMPQLATSVEEADEQKREARHSRDDAAEQLRAAGLSATREGPVPADEPAILQARLDGVQEALRDAVVDQRLLDAIEETQQELADLGVRLDADPALRSRAEKLADTDDARHPVALNGAVERAREREARAREDHAKAQQAAEAARREHQRWTTDRSDRTSPDITGVPAASDVTSAEDTDRFAGQLDQLATEALDNQRSEERLVCAAEDSAREAEQAMRLVKATVGNLRYLADPGVTGRRSDDISALTTRITEVTDQVRTCQQALTNSEAAEHRAVGSVRAAAHGNLARTVEEAADARVVELISRLRSDENLPSEADHLAGQLEQRVASLRDDLDRHEQNVLNSARILYLQATKALTRLRSYQNQSQLPDGLGDWSQRHFVLIEHEKVPADESIAVDRIVRVIHALLTPGASTSDPEALLFAAVRELVDAPFHVRLLKPHTDLRLDRVDVSELKNFSGGQRVTAGVLLYAAMTKVRSMGEASSIGWLWLDNPFGQASADQFVRTMRRAADKMELQLLFTAAPKDKGALSMFDRIITLGRRLRPSSREGVVVIDDGACDVVDLELLQRDVMKVLGE
ncbi:hypothetical protein ABZ953_08245 [Streptomyces sp. NPDC046465]|uniref:hypothetical protein n=1 Tax=Streptomyces sp. NPDC046465 TaxID=3155810 RepID=UPI0034101FF2